MTLSSVISERQGRRAVIANRTANEAAGKRVDEIGAVTDIEKHYRAADSAGDLEMEDQFRALYGLADDEDERSAVTHAFAVWMRAERREELALTDAVTDAVTVLKRNNDYWLAEARKALTR